MTREELDAMVSNKATGNKVLKAAFSGMPYRVLIDNTGSSAVSRTIAMLPGFHSDVNNILDSAGAAVAAIMVEGNTITATNANLVTNGDPRKITVLKDMLKHNKLVLTGIKVISNLPAQFSKNLLIRRGRLNNPEQGLMFAPQTYKSDQSNNTTQCDVDLTDKFQGNQAKYFIFDANTEMIYTIGAGVTLDITFFFEEKQN